MHSKIIIFFHKLDSIYRRTPVYLKYRAELYAALRKLYCVHMLTFMQIEKVFRIYVVKRDSKQNKLSPSRENNEPC